MSEQKTVFIKLTSAIVLDGDIAKPGETVEVTEKEARNLLHRGKGELVAQEVDLTSLNVEALRKLADDAGIEGFAKLKKDELIAALTALQEKE